MRYLFLAAVLVAMGAGTAGSQPVSPCDRDPKGLECTLCRHSGACAPQSPSSSSPPAQAGNHPCGRSMWLERCPQGVADVERLVAALQKSSDACNAIVKDATGFRDSRMGFGFRCDKDMADLQRQLDALEGFDLPANPPIGGGAGASAPKHLEACVDALIKPIYESVVPEAIRKPPPPVTSAAGGPTPSPAPPSPSSPGDTGTRSEEGGEMVITPMRFDELNRLLAFKSIDIPDLDIRLREQAGTIDALRHRMRIYKKDCGG